jgi:hypothetical protein
MSLDVAVLKEYEDIRPYETPEEMHMGIDLFARRAVSELKKSKNKRLKYIAIITSAIGNLRVLGFANKIIPWWIKRNVKTAEDYQSKYFFPIIMSHVDQETKMVTNDYEVIGEENINPNQPYLVVSTHRDIALEAILTSKILYEIKGKTPYTFGGDNLYNTPEREAQYKLTKTIMLIRSENREEKLKQLNRVFNYAKFRMEEGFDAWIAQSPGRIYDALFKTYTGIIRSAWNANMEFILPSATSFRINPSDLQMAVVLWKEANNIKHEKDDNEDNDTVNAGVFGYKGGIKVGFGEPVAIGKRGSTREKSDLAKKIDEEIMNVYHIWDTNDIAFNAMYEKISSTEYRKRTKIDYSTVFEHEELRKRFYITQESIDMFFKDPKTPKPTPEEIRPYILLQYANPKRRKMEVLNKVKFKVV